MQSIKFKLGVPGVVQVIVDALDTFALEAAKDFGIKLDPMPFHPNLMFSNDLNVETARRFAAHCE